MLVRKTQTMFALILLLVGTGLAYQEQQGQNAFLSIWSEYPVFYANYTGQGDCTIRFNDGGWTDPIYMEKTDSSYSSTYELSEGTHEWTVSCFDGNENLLLTDNVEVKSSASEEDDYGQIEWKNGSPFGKDEEEKVIVDYRLVSVDTSSLNPSANLSARVVLKNTDIYGRPKLCYKPGFSQFYTEVIGNCRDCEADGVCTLVNYSDGEVVFDVNHFCSVTAEDSGMNEAPEFSTVSIIIIFVVLCVGFFVYKKKFS